MRCYVSTRKGNLKRIQIISPPDGLKQTKFLKQILHKSKYKFKKPDIVKQADWKYFPYFAHYGFFDSDLKIEKEIKTIIRRKSVNHLFNDHNFKVFDNDVSEYASSLHSNTNISNISKTEVRKTMQGGPDANRDYNTSGDKSAQEQRIKTDILLSLSSNVRVEKTNQQFNKRNSVIIVKK